MVSLGPDGASLDTDIDLRRRSFRLETQVRFSDSSLTFLIFRPFVPCAMEVPIDHDWSNDPSCRSLPLSAT